MSTEDHLQRMTAIDRVCSSRPTAWAFASFVVALTFFAQSARLAEPDIAYFLYSAGRLLDGAKLYRDVVDMNPPAIFAYNLPVAWLARTSHLPDILLYRVATLVAIAGLLLFVRRLLRRYVLPGRPSERRFVLLLGCVVLFPLSEQDFGQREHLVLALLLPYLTIVIARLDRRQVPSLDASVAGALAGLALTLKPPFAIAWLALELWYRWRGAPLTRRVTPELWGVVGVTAAYMVALATITPDYLRLVTVLGGPFTAYLRSSSLNLLLLAPGAALTVFAALGAIATRGAGQDSQARAALAVAMLGCFLAGVAQQKDLRYHFYPSFGLATLLLGLVAAQSASHLRITARVYARVAKSLVAAIVLVAVASAGRELLGGNAADRRQRAEFGELLKTVRTRARGESIGVLSYHMGSAFPLVNYAGVDLASRFACLWILPATYWDALSSNRPIRYRTPADMPPPERMLNQAVSDDLLRAQPRLLLILRPFPDEQRYGFRRLNYVAYFGRRPELADFFGRYQLVAAKGQYDVYERVDPGATLSGPPPSAVVPPLVPGASSGDRPPQIDPELAAGAAIFVATLIGSLLRVGSVLGWATWPKRTGGKTAGSRH